MSDSSRREAAAAGRKGARRRREAWNLALESLEGRLLLTRAYPIPLGPPPNVKNVRFDNTAYTLRLEGPGVIRTRGGGPAGVAVTLLGTTEQSVLTVTPRQSSQLFRGLGLNVPLNPHGSGEALPIKRLDVRTGRLGGIDSPTWVDLVGPVSPLEGMVALIRVHEFGPNARLEIDGNLGTLTADKVGLGPAGRIDVEGSLLGAFEVRDLGLAGGQFLVGQDLVGPSRIGSLEVEGGGRLFVGRDVVAGLVVEQDARLSDGGVMSVGGDIRESLHVGGQLTVAPGGSMEVGQSLGRLSVGQELEVGGGRIVVGSNLGGLVVGQDVRVTRNGLLAVGRDLTGEMRVGGGFLVEGALFEIRRDLTAATEIEGDLALTGGGNWRIGRDATQTLRIDGDLVISAGSELTVGRNSAGISVGGNIDTSGDGVLRVGGNLDGLLVEGAIVGKGAVGESDIVVGLDLNNLRVLGIVPGRGGVTNADIDVAKNLVGLEVRHGIFNSFVTAGVLIDGGASAPSGGNVGPDGPVAVYNSEIRAGVQIRNIVLNGDVVSDLPSNPRGRLTRIVAGLDRLGKYTAGGNIDNFQITGALVDAVLAASVKPDGGDGNLTDMCSDTPGDGTYDAPAGVIQVGTFGAPVPIYHGSPASYNELYQLTGYVYDVAVDPTIDDCVLPGAINRSFKPVIPANPDPNAQIPKPLKSTVQGGVWTTSPHVPGTDFAGIFAADTSGVILGVV